MRYFIVDAFSTVAFGGNPAGVILIDDNMDFPSDETMIKTAAELKYTETAFIKKLGNNEFNTRYFNTKGEVDLCGHATIAAFTILRNEGIVENDTIAYNYTKAGKLEISVTEESVVMEMESPKILGAMDNPEELYNIVGIKYEEISSKKQTKNMGKKMPMIISTTLPDIMTPVASIDVLHEIAPNFRALMELSKRYEIVGVNAFGFEEKEVEAITKNITLAEDLRNNVLSKEEISSLADMLEEYGLLDDDGVADFFNGKKNKTSSMIKSSVKEIHGETKMQVGGTGVVLAEGNIFLD